MKEDMFDFGAGERQQRIVEILVFLVDKMRAHQAIAEIDLTPLSDRGFTQMEISTAFSWLFDKIATTPERSAPSAADDLEYKFYSTDAPRTSSIRVFHEVERSVLSKDAQGYLLQLRELGLMTDADLEMIIDRIMLSGVSRVDMRELKELVASVMFDFDEGQKQASRFRYSDRIQ